MTKEGLPMDQQNIWSTSEDSLRSTLKCTQCQKNFLDSYDVMDTVNEDIICPHCKLEQKRDDAYTNHLDTDKQRREKEKKETAENEQEEPAKTDMIKSDNPSAEMITEPINPVTPSPNGKCIRCNRDSFFDLSIDIASEYVRCPKCRYNQKYGEASLNLDNPALYKKMKMQQKNAFDHQEIPAHMRDGITYAWTTDENSFSRPDKWIGWHKNSGMPIITTKKTKKTKKDDEEEEVEEHYTDDSIVTPGYDSSRGPLLDKITRASSDEGEIIVFDNEVFSKKDFLKLMTSNNRSLDLLDKALEALPLSDEKYRGPYLYEEKGHYILPDRIYPNKNSDYQKTLFKSMKIGPVDKEKYDRAMKMLRKYNKQLTLYYAIIGANIVNIMKVHDYPITIQAIGIKDTGKSFAVVLCLKFAYGLGDSILQDDAMNSAFRHHNLSSLTNLPLYVEEAKIKDKTKLKSRGHNLRGRPDQSMSDYTVEMTLVMSLNSLPDDDALINPDEQEAIAKRVYNYFFNEEDVVSESERNDGLILLQDIKDLAGGLLYEKLNQKTISELKTHYMDLRKTTKDMKEVVALMGAWIMDDPEFKPTNGEAPRLNIKDEFFDWVTGEYLRNKNKQALNSEEDKFMNCVCIDEKFEKVTCTTAGFNLFLKSKKGWDNISATSFAKMAGTCCRSVTLGSRDRRGWGFTLEIPEEFKNKMVSVIQVPDVSGFMKPPWSVFDVHKSPE